MEAVPENVRLITGIVLCTIQMNLSARACHRTLKLACTIADLVGNYEIQPVHLAEAILYLTKLMTG